MTSLSSENDAKIQLDEVISRCRLLVHPTLQAVVEGLHPRTGLMVRYSFGWCSADGDPQPSSGNGAGKGVRQALTVLSAEAVGGSAQDAVPAAVAVELVHAFSLIHDDIMDNDEQRRHRPTVWRAYGVGPAILSGDVLLALAVETVTRSTGDRALRALHLLCDCLRALMQGQAEDMDFEGRPSYGRGAVTAAEYRAMARNKTGALLGCSAALGALSAGGTPQHISAFGAAGREMGLAFQIADDVLGIWGDPARTGKPVGSDLRQRKKTLPVLKLLEQGGELALRLARLFDEQGTMDDSEVAEAVELFDRAGGPAPVLGEGRAALDRVQKALAPLPLYPRARSELVTLSNHLIERVR